MYKIKNHQGFYYEGYEYERNEPYFTDQGVIYTHQKALLVKEFVENKYQWMHLVVELEEVL